MADAGAQAVELDATIPEVRFDEVVAAVRDHGLEIAALEALCPHPAELARHAPGPGRVPLANPDDGERRFAVRLHRAVIARAADVGAATVVLSLGDVELPDGEEPARTAGAAAVRAYLERRATRARRALDAARFALDDLLAAAERAGRRLAIATAPRLSAVPSFVELSALLEEFRGAPLGAWIDVEGAWSLAQRGIRRLETWSELRASVTGARVRDAGEDGAERVPGEGAIDLHACRAIVPGGATEVLSLSSGHDLGRVRDSVAALRGAGWWAR